MMRAVVMLVLALSGGLSEMAQASEPDTFSKRVPPVMPPTAERSGYCCMSMRSGQEGEMKTFSLFKCSQDVSANLRPRQCGSGSSPRPDRGFTVQTGNLQLRAWSFCCQTRQGGASRTPRG